MTTRRIWIDSRSALRSGLVLGVGAVLLLGGCKKPPPPPPPPPPKPYVPPPPEPLDVASLLQSMQVDERVEFAESEAPVDRGLAEAAIHLADAFARGDDDALAGMLDTGGRQILERLKSTEQWYEATEGIEAVRVVSLDGISKGSEAPERTQVAIAIQDPDGAYVLAWAGRKVADNWVFSAAPASVEERPRASAWDGMAPMAAGGSGFESLISGNPELRELLTKAMAGADSLTIEDLLRLREMLAEIETVPAEVLARIEQEIAKRQERESGGGDAGGGRSGGGGGNTPRDRPQDPGPGPGPGGRG